jgi:hypothetical protein
MFKAIFLTSIVLFSSSFVFVDFTVAQVNPSPSPSPKLNLKIKGVEANVESKVYPNVPDGVHLELPPFMIRRMKLSPKPSPTPSPVN